LKRSVSPHLPVAVYEIIHRVRAVRMVVLLVNVLIVAYLIARLLAN